MSVHLHTHSHHAQFASIIHQKKYSFEDTLDIRSKGTNSLWECITNCFKKIWEFIQRLFCKKQVEIKPLTMDDVDNIVIHQGCAESNPCQHQNTLFLKDGRHVSLSAPDICSIVCRIAKDRINMNNNPEYRWVGDVVINHFRAFNDIAEPADDVLNRVFAQKV
jgi:hypothetical protein